MKIRGWAADTGGCAFYRLESPFGALNARGHDVKAAITADHSWDDADVIVGMRVALPGPSRKWWARWAETGVRLVYDIDDDYLRLDRSNPAFDFYAAADTRARIIANIGLADAVTCATPRLAEAYRQYNANVIVVPNSLPETILGWERPAPRRPGVTIGWAGTPATLPDLVPLVKTLRRFLDRHPNVELHTVGIAESALRGIGLRHPQLRVTPHVAGTVEYLKRIDFDVWVAPYRSTLFNGCKVATKALEASALGVPIVASATVPYREHVRDGETGILIHRDHEWDRALRDLVNDADLRARMGAAARVQAADHTTEKIAPLWEQALGGTA